MSVSAVSSLGNASVFSLNQYPEPLESGLGSTRQFSMHSGFATNRAMIHQNALYRDQYPAPAPSGVGSTPVLPSKGLIVNNTAMINRRSFLREQYPAPAPNRIGQGDLPGGFKKGAIISGQSSPLYDLSRGIIQVNGVKVLFDARA